MMSRAGLIYLIILTVCINLAASAPVPGRIARNFAERHDDFNNNLVVRHLALLVDREFDPVFEYKGQYLSHILEGDYDLDAENNQYNKREYDGLFQPEEREFDELEHTYSKAFYRRNFWDKIKSGFKNAGNAVRHSFRKVQSGFQRVRGAIRSGFHRAGRAIGSVLQKAGAQVKKGIRRLKTSFQKVGAAARKGFQRVRAGFQKAGTKIKNGIQKVGQYFQNASGAIKNVGKATKFGLKVVAAAASVGSKVAKFVPGIGTGVGIALKGAALGANEVSNKIPISFGGQLDKISESMDFVISPTGSLSKLAANANGPGGKALAVAESLLL